MKVILYASFVAKFWYGISRKYDFFPYPSQKCQQKLITRSPNAYFDAQNKNLPQTLAARMNSVKMIRPKFEIILYVITEKLWNG